MIEQIQRVFTWCYNTLRNEEGFAPLNALRELNKLLFVKWFYEGEGNEAFYEEAVSRGMVMDDHEKLQRLFTNFCSRYEMEGYFSKYEELRVSPTTCSMVWNWLRRYNLNSPESELADGYDSFVAKTLKGLTAIRYFDNGIADYMVEALNIQPGGIIVDYSCGYGSLLVNIQKKQKANGHHLIYGFDSDSLMAQITKLSLIMHGDLRTQIECRSDLKLLPFVPDVDLIIGSIPHGGKIDGRPQDANLIEFIVDKLSPGGRAAMLVSDMVLSGSQYEYMRYMLLRYGQILNITSLPINAVKVGEAKSKCSIIFFEKGENSLGQPIMLTKIEDIGYSSLGLPTEKNDLRDNLPLVKGWITSREQGTNKQTHYVDPQNLESLEVDSVFAKINASIIGNYNRVNLHDVISQRIQYRERLEDNNKYRRVTVRKNQHDIVMRDVVMGSEIKGKYMTPIHTGQFVISRIGAKEGAIGIVPEELDGSYVTNEFYVLELNKNIITPYFLLLLLTSDTYQGMLRGLSRGATGLSRLPYRSLEDLTIPLPTLKEQLSLTGKMEETRAKINQMEKDWNEALVNFNQKMFGK